jgi:hypothetical protein
MDWDAYLTANAASLNIPDTSSPMSPDGDTFGPGGIQRPPLAPKSAFGMYRSPHDSLSSATPSHVNSYSPFNATTPSFLAELAGIGSDGDVFFTDEEQDTLDRAHEVLLAASSRRGSQLDISSAPGSHRNSRVGGLRPTFSEAFGRVRSRRASEGESTMTRPA